MSIIYMPIFGTRIYSHWRIVWRVRQTRSKLFEEFSLSLWMSPFTFSYFEPYFVNRWHYEKAHFEMTHDSWILWKRSVDDISISNCASFSCSNFRFDWCQFFRSQFIRNGFNMLSRNNCLFDIIILYLKFYTRHV